MFGIIKLTIHTITGMWVSIVLFKLMTNGWSGFYFQCCVLSLVFLTVSWLLSGEWLAGKRKAEAYRTEIKLPNGRLHGGMRKDFQLIGKWKQGLEQT